MGTQSRKQLTAWRGERACRGRLQKLSRSVGAGKGVQAEKAVCAVLRRQGGCDTHLPVQVPSTSVKSFCFTVLSRLGPKYRGCSRISCSREICGESGMESGNEREEYEARRSRP